MKPCGEQSSHSVSSSLQNQIDASEHSSFSMSSLLKNEIDLLKYSLRFWFQACIKMKPCFEQSSHSMSSSLQNEIVLDHHANF